MADVPVGLAALVTQAPEDPSTPIDTGPAEASRDDRKAKQAPCSGAGYGAGWLCRCFTGKDRSPKHKMTSVVPTETPPDTLQSPRNYGKKEESHNRSQAASSPSIQPERKSHEPQEPPQQLLMPQKQVHKEPEPCAPQSNREPPQLGPQVGANMGRKTLVLDLDETLVHSSFRTVRNADIVIAVEIEGEHHQVYVRKRPGCDEFLLRVAPLYEVVIYTASMSKYASPLLDKLDTHNVCTWRLYREACTRLQQGYVKDLSRLGRNLKHVIIIDNSPTCYALQPDNAIPIRTWRDDMSDRELLDLIPILYSLADVDDIPQVLKQIIWSAEDEEEEQQKSGSK